MQKTLVLLCAAVLMLSLCACSSDLVHGLLPTPPATEIPESEPSTEAAPVTDPSVPEATVTEPVPSEPDETVPEPTEITVTEPAPTEPAETDPEPTEATLPANGILTYTDEDGGIHEEHYDENRVLTLELVNYPDGTWTEFVPHPSGQLVPSRWTDQDGTEHTATFYENGNCKTDSFTTDEAQCLISFTEDGVMQSLMEVYHSGRTMETTYDDNGDISCTITVDPDGTRLEYYVEGDLYRNITVLPDGTRYESTVNADGIFISTESWTTDGQHTFYEYWDSNTVKHSLEQWADGSSAEFYYYENGSIREEIFSGGDDDHHSFFDEDGNLLDPAEPGSEP